MAGEPLQNAHAGYDASSLSDRIWLVERRKAPGLPLRMINPLLPIIVLAIMTYGALRFVDQRNLNAVIAIGVICVGLFLIFVIHALRLNNKGKVNYSSVPGSMPEAPKGARMVAIGHPNDIGPLSEMVDRPIEPVIVERTVSQVYITIVTFSVIGLSVAASFLFNFRNPFFEMNYALALTLGLVAGHLGALLRPIYFRVVPGRLDIIRFDGLRKKPLSIQRFNLRNSRIVANFGFRTVEISNPLIPRLRITLMHFSEPHRFVQGIFQGAICTTPAPPLPDDELLG